ncbi:Universal stress protein [Gossypium australe]|uniref:Universal stress protein n=1 Tax=Gossypium australe TaxID=47621 RepID=A0A5B6W0B4_9ROSI|nr:Universal stress protein [Gossypium australe]
MSSFGFWKSSSTNCSSLSSTDSDGFCALFGYSSSRYFKARKAKAVPQPQDSELSLVADALTHFKHLLLPITDRNPYLSEGTRQAAATTAALSKNYGADITVVGGFKEFKLLERLGEGSKATAIIAEVADDLNLYLVVMSMEAIRSKHVDANLLVEFIPCPVLFLPL